MLEGETGGELSWKSVRLGWDQLVEFLPTMQEALDLSPSNI